MGLVTLDICSLNSSIFVRNKGRIVSMMGEDMGTKNYLQDAHQEPITNLLYDVCKLLFKA